MDDQIVHVPEQPRDGLLHRVISLIKLLTSVAIEFVLHPWATASLYSSHYGETAKSLSITTAWHALSLIFKLAIILVLSIFSYYILYRVWVPATAFTRFVSLARAPPAYQHGEVDFTVTDADAAILSVFKNLLDQNLTVGSVIPHDTSAARFKLLTSGPRTFLSPGHVYDITMTAKMPTCPLNRNIGAVGIEFTLFDSRRNRLHVHETTMNLPYDPLIIRYLRLIPWIWCYVIGWCESEYDVEVPVVFAYSDRLMYPLAIIEMIVKDPSVIIGSPSIRVDARMSGIVYWMAHFKWSSFILGSTILFWAITVFYALYSIISHYTGQGDGGERTSLVKIDYGKTVRRADDDDDDDHDD